MSAIGLSNADDGQRTKTLIKPTDSDYVRYAKQGGDKDLLVAHEIEKSTAPKPYSKVDWFSHIHNHEEDASNLKTSNQLEDIKTHVAHDNDGLTARQEGNKIKQKYTTGGVPFHTDNLSVWERKEQEPETAAERNRRRARNPIF